MSKKGIKLNKHFFKFEVNLDVKQILEFLNISEEIFFKYNVKNLDTLDFKINQFSSLYNSLDDSLVFYNEILASSNKEIKSFIVPHTSSRKVSEILMLLKEFKSQYLDNGQIPKLELKSFELDLFNTFRSFIPKDYFPRKFKKNSDSRGVFVEILRANSAGQTSYSTTFPGITRGNHYHTRKIERFAVISGKALIQIRKVDSNIVYEYIIDGNEPAYVDMPIWYTHNIKNIGNTELLTLFWINEPYNSDDSDTYFINV